MLNRNFFYFSFFVLSFLLFLSYENFFLKNEWLYLFPHFNFIINTSTIFFLTLGFIFIKKKKIYLHKKFMIIAFLFGFFFLIFYLVYHFFILSTIYGDIIGNGVLTKNILYNIKFWRFFYLVVLFSHIFFSILSVPFVLLSIFYSLNNYIEKHKKIVKYSFPIWFYVSTTGVIVYFMISFYY